ESAEGIAFFIREFRNSMKNQYYNNDLISYLSSSIWCVPDFETRHLSVASRHDSLGIRRSRPSRPGIKAGQMPIALAME
ncbi:MAG TPA: hypothetical protein VL996_09640, partial [Methylocella sp.]|nr:hypothetical protein [Methylocella sp.]